MTSFCIEPLVADVVQLISPTLFVGVRSIGETAERSLQVTNSTVVEKTSCKRVGKGGQLRLSHLTPAAPSAGQGLGSDLAILGANPGVSDVRSFHRAP